MCLGEKLFEFGYIRHPNQFRDLYNQERALTNQYLAELIPYRDWHRTEYGDSAAINIYLKIKNKLYYIKKDGRARVGCGKAIVVTKIEITQIIKCYCLKTKQLYTPTYIYKETYIYYRIWVNYLYYMYFIFIMIE